MRLWAQSSTSLSTKFRAAVLFCASSMLLLHDNTYKYSLLFVSLYIWPVYMRVIRVTQCSYTFCPWYHSDFSQHYHIWWPHLVQATSNTDPVLYLAFGAWNFNLYRLFITYWAFQSALLWFLTLLTIFCQCQNYLSFLYILYHNISVLLAVFLHKRFWWV